MSKYIIRNTFAVAASLIIICLMCTFYKGEAIYENIQGEWKCIDNDSEYIFIGVKYFHDSKSGLFKIRGNKITFDSEKKKFFRVTKIYLKIDVQYYLKQ